MTELPKLVAVVGGGTMGSGIAQVSAQSGFSTLLIDRMEEDLERALKRIESSWQRAIDREKLTPADVDAARQQLQVTTHVNDAGPADFVVEAIFEDLAVKRALMTELAATVSTEAILATNTSSISISELAEGVPNQGRVIGMHFFNPVPAMALVEVVRGHATSAHTSDRTAAFAIALGKTPVLVNDAPGFVVNRLLLPMINEAIGMLAAGTADATAIDEAIRLGAGHPMGPLELADLIGLDVCLAILQVLHNDLADDKYRPADLLVEMVESGKLGQKSGQGFYQYPRETRK